MSDLLRTGSDWLESQRTAHMTSTVVYQRGVSSVEVPATIGRTVFEVDDGFGTLVRIESRDYLILAEHLVLDDQVTLPQCGDRIRETEGSQTHVYEVMAPGKEPPWRYSDPFRKTLRVHTKQIDTEQD
jgi:hypothetical protein